MTGFHSKREAAADKLQEPAQEPVADRLERLLWEYIDLQAAHPEHKPNPKTWPHLMTYAPLPAQPVQEPVAELRRLHEVNEDLLKAMRQLACLGNGDRYGNSYGNVIAQLALNKATGETE